MILSTDGQRAGGIIKVDIGFVNALKTPKIIASILLNIFGLLGILVCSAPSHCLDWRPKGIISAENWIKLQIFSKIIRSTILFATTEHDYTSLLDFVGPLYILQANFVIIVPKNGLAPNDAGQSAGTVMTTFEFYSLSNFTGFILFSHNQVTLQKWPKRMKSRDTASFNIWPAVTSRWNISVKHNRYIKFYSTSLMFNIISF